jgi:hypothetical protein
MLSLLKMNFSIIFTLGHFINLFSHINFFMNKEICILFLSLIEHQKIQIISFLKYSTISLFQIMNKSLSGYFYHLSKNIK